MNKRVVMVSVLSLLVVIVWYLGNMKLRQAHPEWYQPQQEQAAPAGQNETPAPPATQNATQPAVQPATQVVVQTQTQPTIAQSTGILVLAGKGKQWEIGSNQFDAKGEKSAFPMGVTIEPEGAAISSVTLNRLRAKQGKEEPYVFQKPYGGDLDRQYNRSMLTQAIIVNGSKAELHDQTWNLEASSSESATYSIDLMLSNGTKLKVKKVFGVKPDKHDSKGYELSVNYRIENQGGSPVGVKLYFNGPLAAAPENNRDVPEIVTGFNDQKQVVLKHHSASSLNPEKPPFDVLGQEKLPLMWTGLTSSYFDSIVRPAVDPAQNIFKSVTARALAKRTDDGEEFPAIGFETNDFEVAAGGFKELPFEVYLGPRQRSILKSDYYAQFPRNYDETLVLTGGMCGWCTFETLITVMVSLLGFFFKIMHDWGLAIICLVIIVRLLLHPITKRSQVSMSRMSKLGPEIKRIQDKHKDDKEAMNREMMAFYKEHGVSNFLGCLPMFLQMPIWIALWSSLQSTFELRHASFLWGFTWIKDLSQPDRLFAFSHAWNWWMLHVDAINLLPILMGVVFFIQQKMSPRPPTMTPEQEQQYKIMQWMSLLFPLVLYNGPSGLNLYILTSTAIGIVESKRIRDHIKQREEAEKEGKIIVEAKPTSRSKKLGRIEDQQAAKPGCVMGWLAELQKKAEEVRREGERRGRKP